jgi:hypothetical protein
MMHPTISEALAKSRQQQFRREAEQWSLARSRAASVRARPGRTAAAVTGLAAGLAARVRQPPPRRPATGPAQGRLMRMPQGGNAPSPRTGDFMLATTNTHEDPNGVHGAELGPGRPQSVAGLEPPPRRSDSEHLAEERA